MRPAQAIADRARSSCRRPQLIRMRLWQAALRLAEAAALASGRFALAGTFTADGAGNITGGAMDTNDAGVDVPNSNVSGAYSVAPNGRAALTLTPSAGQPMHLSLYLNASSAGTSFFFVDTDAPGTDAPNLAGAGQAQTGIFSSASLNAPAVIWTEGVDAGGADVTAGLFTGDGLGNLAVATDENDSGTIRTNQFTWSYSVAANGRVTLDTGAGNSPVLYLSGANSGYYVSSDASVATGELQAQSGPSFSIATVTGAWSGGSSAPAVPSAADFAIALSVNSSGDVAATEDISSSSGLQTTGMTDVISSVAPTGRVSFASANSVGWIVSGSHWVLLDLIPGNTAGTVIQLVK